MKKILISVGTRPNFIKVTRFKEVAVNYPDFDFVIVHTGQHYDTKMADVFFKQFGLTPDYLLEIPRSSPNTQMAEIMLRTEHLINKIKPDMVMVPGDVNSTLAVALTANKMEIPLAHIESGLRSYDMTMPEEFNRKLTDHLADICFVTEQSGLANLNKEGKSKKQVSFVGNTMIDTFVAFSKDIKESDILNELSLDEKKYILMTMHRPATVDDKKGLTKLAEIIEHIALECTVVFPAHPRTKDRIIEYGLENRFNSIPALKLILPMDYFAFQKLILNAMTVVTDSGGIQEETTYYNVPCLTLRSNTERPSTVNLGTNELLPLDIEVIINRIALIKSDNKRLGKIPPLWDGNATERIVKVLSQTL